MREDRKNVSGWYWVGGKLNFFRSLLELRWACLLELYKRTSQIKEWEYEPEKFLFFGDHIPKGLKGKKFGVRDYKPDFKVTGITDTVEYHECKGRMDKKSLTKLRCMKHYFPDLKIDVIVDFIPRGQTIKSRKKRMLLLEVKALGYELHEMRPIHKKLGHFLMKMAQEKSTAEFLAEAAAKQTGMKVEGEDKK